MSPDRSIPGAERKIPESAVVSRCAVPKPQLTSQRDRCVYVVDDDASVSESLIMLLETYGFEAAAYRSGVALLADPRHCRMGCLIIDQHMPGMDGLAVVAALQREGILVPTILISGRVDAAVTGRANKLGVTATLEKPLAIARLIALVRASLENAG
jgi:FixJ family two-component response regulator